MANVQAFESGYQQGYGAMEQRHAHKQALSDMELEGKIKDLIGQRSALVSKLPALLGEDGKPTPEYNQAFDALKQVNAGLVDAYHPQKNPGAIQKLGHLLTDHLGIKVNGEGEDAGKKVTLPELRKDKASAASTKRDQSALQSANRDVAAGPLSPEQQARVDVKGTAAKRLASFNADMDFYDKQNPHATSPEATDEEKDARGSYRNERIQFYGEGTNPNVVGNWEVVEGKIDGEPVSLDHDKKYNKWRYHSGEVVPQDKMIAFRPDPKAKVAAKKGMTVDAATGQVVDHDANKRYNPGDPNNPPEVAAMFKGAEGMLKKKQAFQLELAKSGRATFNMTRPMQAFDTQNGNAPTVVTFEEMRKNPSRYLPAGEAGKALAKENLMSDIAGTSVMTRQAINALDEDFPEDMKVKITLAMKADDPHAALDQLIASSAIGNLSDNQQNFLIATRQLAENAMAMRSILGAGQGSEDMRNAVRDTLPGLLSPDKSYALRQLDAFDATIQRLHRGVPKVPLRTDLGDGTGAHGGNTPPPSGGSKPQGAIGTVEHNGKNYWVDAKGKNLGVAP